ncbi:MAG: GNAT family N-acetyltransferase [Planctomycetes bacterium]|nr:GNAT family N-acetyltransferase [Planctomycetota bacterium]
MQRSTVASLLRSTQAYCSQICDKETLPFGIAYYSRRFAALPQANQLREVVFDDPGRIAAAFDQAQAWFAQRELVCHRWAPAEGQAPQPIGACLASRGFLPRASVALALTQWPQLEVPAGVRVLPARAVRAAFLASYAGLDAPSAAVEAQERESAGERLDDPQFDAFVAVIDGEPAGRGALYQVGDMARIIDLFIRPVGLDRGADRALLAHLLTLARRLAMRHIYAQVEAEQRGCLELLQRAGFVADGEIVEFHRQPAPPPRAWC